MTCAINFHKKIYQKNLILKAVSAYSRFAEFKVIEKGLYIRVFIKALDASLQKILPAEFSNYVLGLTTHELQNIP